MQDEQNPLHAASLGAGGRVEQAAGGHEERRQAHGGQNGDAALEARVGRLAYGVHGGGGQIERDLGEAADGEEREPDPGRAAAEALAEDEPYGDDEVDEEDDEGGDVDNGRVGDEARVTAGSAHRLRDIGGEARVGGMEHADGGDGEGARLT